MRLTAMAGKDLKALFHRSLEDAWFAENAILKVLPKMAKAAASDDLRGTFASHVEETRGQVKRLDKVFKLIGGTPQGVECRAIMGIIAEGEEMMEEFCGGEAADAGLIASAKAIEHYEITRYGTLLTWARQLGYDEAADLLAQTLGEEENTDRALSTLSERAGKPSAAA